MELAQEKVTLDEVEFHFEKLSALEGWRLLEKVRVALANTNSPIDASTMTGVGDMARSVMGLDESFVEEVRRKLFKKVRFVTTTMDGKKNSPQTLLDAEDAAFQFLTPAHVYEVLIRAFVVNFTESWSAMMSKLPNGALAGFQPVQ